MNLFKGPLKIGSNELITHVQVRVSDSLSLLSLSLSLCVYVCVCVGRSVYSKQI